MIRVVTGQAKSTNLFVDFFYRKEEKMKKSEDQIIYSPVKGSITSLSEVEDPMFREEMLGKTICIQPVNSMVYAPFDGNVSVMYPSGHAVGMTRSDGLEILIHVGIDTVELQGTGFCAQVKQQESVKKNTPLLKFDTSFIKSRGYSSQIFIVFTNSKKFQFDVKTGREKDIRDILCYAEKL